MVRGGLRGTRGSMRGGIRGPFKKAFVPRHPFDSTLAEMAFPKVATIPDDSALTNVWKYFVFFSMLPYNL